MNDKNIYTRIRKNFETIFRGREEEWEELRRRLDEAENDNARDKALVEGKEIRDDVLIRTNTKLYLPAINVEKTEAALEGLELKLVTDPASETFAKAWLLGQMNFPVYEIDPKKVLEEFLDATKDGLTFENFNKEKTFTRYVCSAVIDKTGKFGEKGAVIAETDGTFLANNEMTVLYGAHIVGLPEARRQGVCSALRNATLNKCHEFALEAEKALRTSYKTNKAGLKIGAFMNEIEFPNLSDEESVKATIGRYFFHGKNGIRVCALGNPQESGVRYLQSDTTYDQESDYDAKKWTSVPLFLGLRFIGDENQTELPGNTVGGSQKAMYIGFDVGGMNHKGVLADWAYAEKYLGDKVQMHRLPQTPQEAVEFVKQVGEAYQILTTYYQDHNFTKQNAEKYRPIIALEDIPSILAHKR